jgi:hypothetical protein
MSLFGVKPWQMATCLVVGYLAMDYGIRPFFQLIAWLGGL